MFRPRCLLRSLCVTLMVLAFAAIGRSDDGGWIDLTGLTAWQSPIEGWSTVGSASLNAVNPKRLAFEPGAGIIANDSNGKALNLISLEKFEDIDLHLEFNIPKSSNSGVKFQAVYEVQISDSFGAKTLKGSDCGGVYPRSEEKPKYHHIDDGHAPLVNAAKPPGEWQTLDLTFLAPRFDTSGKKVANARITAILNGKTVQDSLEVETPTGAAWKNKEQSTGPILLQADHGPVAFRNVKARRLSTKH